MGVLMLHYCHLFVRRFALFFFYRSHGSTRPAIPHVCDTTVGVCVVRPNGRGGGGNFSRGSCPASNVKATACTFSHVPATSLFGLGVVGSTLRDRYYHNSQPESAGEQSLGATSGNVSPAVLGFCCSVD